MAAGNETTDDSMSFVSRRPRHSLLQGLVDRVWCSKLGPSHTISETRVEWVLPTCRAQIILTPSGSVLVGPKVIAEKIERQVRTPMVGVVLTADAVPAFLGHGGGELIGLTVPLDTAMALGSLPEQLAEQTADTTQGGTTPSETALNTVEAEMVKRLKGPSIDRTVVAVERAIRGGHSAGATIARLGVDRRTFVPKFRSTVGVAPKHYERICRFNRAVENVRRPDARSLASIAADHGFADQAHLTREVRHFALTSPALIHRDGSRMVNHIEPDKIFKTGPNRKTTMRS